VFDAKELSEDFWDDYVSLGIRDAYHNLSQKVPNDDTLDEKVREMGPHLFHMAKDRDIDVVKFLNELDEVMKEVENARRTDNGASELRVDSSDEVDEPSNEDESASASDVDGEDRSE
jgi:hypothetical protein